MNPIGREQQMQFATAADVSGVGDCAGGKRACRVIRFSRARYFFANRRVCCRAPSMTGNSGSLVSATSQFEAQRREMVAQQLRKRGVRSEGVLAAMSVAPRHEFVPAERSSEAYSDQALSIGDGQTISQPYVVAAVAEALALQGHERVLEIGGGSGYQAAVLSKLAHEVITVEFLPQLAVAARERLKRLGFSNVHVEQGDGSLGWPMGAPYDAILVSAGAPQIPSPLLEQLLDGGRLIVPVGTIAEQNLIRVFKRGLNIQQEPLFACRFVPLHGCYGWPADSRGLARP
jgi:protein-L-isoaspartate(D-aspartate) O-methyltransferase